MLLPCRPVPFSAPLHGVLCGFMIVVRAFEHPTPPVCVAFARLEQRGHSPARFRASRPISLIASPWVHCDAARLFDSASRNSLFTLAFSMCFLKERFTIGKGFGVVIT
jgi:hypothetical protein